MRDLKADQEICKKATPGPWERDTDYIISPDKAITILCDHPTWERDAAFIAAAREGWPEAIERAIVAESLIENAGKELREWMKEVKRLEEEVKMAMGGEQYWKDRGLQAEAQIATLTEENDLQRASIQELRGQVARMQRVVDVANEVTIRLGPMFPAPSMMSKLIHALAELEGAHDL